MVCVKQFHLVQHCFHAEGVVRGESFIAETLAAMGTLGLIVMVRVAGKAMIGVISWLGDG